MYFVQKTNKKQTIQTNKQTNKNKQQNKQKELQETKQNKNTKCSVLLQIALSLRVHEHTYFSRS